MRRLDLFAMAAAIAMGGCLQPSAYAVITTSGSFTGGGTPYNGVDDPWVTTLLVVGRTAPGSMAIDGGSDVINDVGTIAFDSTSSTSSVTVAGVGSTWTNPSGLTVGFRGTGTLGITDGAAVSSDTLYVGYESTGTVTVGGGAGASTLICTGANVGFRGIGQLEITGGGSMSSTGGVIGSSSSGNGTVTVGGGTGASTWAIVNALSVGGGSGGTGKLSINTGGLVSAARLDGGNATSSVNFNGGTLRINGTDSASDTVNLLAGGGTIDVPTAATTFTIISAMTGAGGLTKTGDATLALTNANGYMGNTTVSNGTLTLSGAGSLAASPTVSVASGAMLNVSGVTSGANYDGTRFALASGQTLKGTGSVTGTVAVRAGATIAPGDSIGELDTQSVLLTAASAKLDIELDVDLTPAADLLDVAGTVNLGGGTLNLTLLNVPLSLASPRTYLILRNDSTDAVLGTFGAITGLPSGYLATINYAYAGTDILLRTGNGNDVAVTLSAVPEAGAWLLVAAATAGVALYKLRRHGPDSAST